MYCRSCQYPLQQLTSRNCPECGLVFDPQDPRTFLRRRPGRKVWVALVVGGLLGWLAMSFLLFAFRLRPTAITPTVVPLQQQAAPTAPEGPAKP